MKSYNNLYSRMMQRDEIKKAIEEAARGRGYQKAVQKALSGLDNKANEEIARIKAGWKPPKHKLEKLQDGSHKKMRMIQKPNWDDEQIIHHMLMRQLRPIILRSLYPYACGSIPKRGTHYALKAMKRWRDGYKNKKFYVAELDIHHFYDSIDIPLLKKQLNKKIRDKKFLDLLFMVLDQGGPGLPKGFYTSPWLSHFLLTPLDYYIVQNLQPDHYLRYADNMFLFCKNKKKLHKMVKQVSIYLGTLHLKLKDDWQVYKFESYSFKKRKITGRAINCLGFVIHRNHVGIRKSILKRARKKARMIKKRHHCRGMDAAAIISYKGYFDYSDTYNYFQKYIKPNISIHYCKRRLAALARKKRKECHDELENYLQQFRNKTYDY